MFKHLFVAIMTITLYVNGDWHDKWLISLNAIASGYPEYGMESIEEAINEAEECGEASLHPYLYIDKARILMYTNAFEAADKAIEKAFGYDLSSSDRYIAYMIKAFICANLGDMEGNEKYYSMFKDAYGGFPNIEITPKRIIVKNIPSCNCYVRLVTKFLQYFVEDEYEDIQVIDATIIVNRTRSPNADEIQELQKSLQLSHLIFSKITYLPCQVESYMAVDFYKRIIE